MPDTFKVPVTVVVAKKELPLTVIPVDEAVAKVLWPETVNVPKVPIVVREEVSTLEANVVPVKVPAGAMTTLVPAAVINPLPLTVKLGMAVEEPHEPVLVFTVAKVVPIEVAPLPETSPLRVIVWLPVK